MKTATVEQAVERNVRGRDISFKVGGYSMELGWVVVVATAKEVELYRAGVYIESHNTGLPYEMMSAEYNRQHRVVQKRHQEKAAEEMAVFAAGE